MNDLKLVLKEREPDSHKGDNGSVLVVGGNREFAGAPALAALAALRTGIDLAVVAAPEKTAWTIQSYSPDLITKKIKGEFFTKINTREIADMAKKFDVVAIGNGIGLKPETAEFVRELVYNVSKPKVIDADAIKALHGMEVMNAVMTPHAKEFELFSGKSMPKDMDQKIELLKTFARKDLVILLKGATDIITDGERVKENKTGNPGMTVGGTGDVLAGLCAGLLAHGGDKFNVACAAAFLNGHVGDELYKKMGYGFTASDMIKEISGVIRRLV